MSDRSPRRAALYTFLTCLLLGPPVGGVALAIGYGVLGVTASETVNGGLVARLIAAASFAVLSIPFSYVVGGVTACVSGLIMAAYGMFRGRPPLALALGVATVLFFVLQNIQTDQRMDAAVSLFVAHVVAAWVCWAVFRWYWDRVSG